MDKVVGAWEVAADQGYAEAQFHLDTIYLHGHGVPQSDKEAVVWCLKAADQGNADAQCSVGVMYRPGQGVPQSDTEAAVWHRKAAD